MPTLKFLKFPDDDYLYHWTPALVRRGDMVEVNVEIVKDKAPEYEVETVCLEEVTPKKKAGRPKKVNDE